jgi:hypothetical protein
LKTSPTQRSKKYLEGLGYRVAIVERWNAFAKCRQDLFNIIDLLAMKDGEPLLAVQTTTTPHLVERMHKAPETVKTWESTGNRFVFHGWAERGARGKKKAWTLDERTLGTHPLEVPT